MPTKTEAREAKLAALHEQLVTATETLLTSEGWLAMVATAAKFHNYSLNNTLLILLQRPDATRVAGFNRWKELGRSVRKGEKGIAILAPLVRKQRDEDTGKDEPRVFGYRTVYVFDEAQTDGEPLPDIRPVLLDGEVPEGLWDKLAAQVAAHGKTLEMGDPGGGANGVVSATRVVIRDDMPALAQLKTLAHELAHIECGHVGSADLHRGRKEVEAESTAAVVLGAYGVDTSDYSTAYVAGWGKDVEEVKDAASAVLKAARTILDAADKAA